MAKSSKLRILSSKIYDLAKKLGAEITGQRALPKRINGCPDFLAEFDSRIQWPKRREYEALNSDDLGLTAVSFDRLEKVPEAQGVLGGDNKDLYAFGLHNGGNWILLIDGNDPQPDDPMVYEVDHEPDSELSEVCPLSKFLAMLEPAVGK